MTSRMRLFIDVNAVADDDTVGTTLASGDTQVMGDPPDIGDRVVAFDADAVEYDAVVVDVHSNGWLLLRIGDQR